MSPSKFCLSACQVDERTSELRIEGELDLAVAARLDEALLATDAERILVDLAACEFIDSSGIAVILRASRRARERGCRILVHSAVEPVRRVLSLTGLDHTDLFFDDRAEAIAAVPPDDDPVKALT